MTRSSVLGAALGVGGFVAGCVCAAAQEPPVTLNLVAPAVRPGAPVYVNASLTNPTGLDLRDLRQVLTFQGRHLRFVRAELGIAAYLADADLTVRFQDASGAAVADADAAERVEVRIVGRMPFVTGPIVEIEFRQVEGQEQVLRLGLTAEVRDSEGTVVEGLAYVDPEVTISNDLGIPALKVFGCFFYMH